MFTAKAIDFLIINRLNDNKIFFKDNQETYQKELLIPFIKLAINLTPLMLSIDENFIVEPKVNKTISRIYRDTRFSKDKSIFRDVMWLVFARKKQLYEGESAFYFEISPNGVRYGCGYYLADSKSMEIFRQMIDDKNKYFVDAFESYKKQNIYEIEGEEYKKNRYKGNDINIQTFYNRRSIRFNAKKDFNFIFSDNLSNELAEDFIKLKEIYNMFREIENIKGSKL